MLITIGRECGCDGDEIGKILADTCQIPCYTKKKLIRLAKEKGIYERYPFYFGEKPIDSMLNPMAEDFRNRLRQTPEEALVSLIGTADCIVIGRASNYAFRNRQDAVRVFLCGDRKMRVKRIQEKHGISEKQADRLVEETDQRRKGYHAYYTGEEWGFASNYDLCLDQTKLGAEGVVSMILAYAKQQAII